MLSNMSAIYMSALILKLRVRLFRLCVHRRHPRLESIYSLALACHHLASPPAPSPTPIGETQVMTQVSPAPSPPTPRHPKKALLIGICDCSKNRTGRHALKGPHNDAEAMYKLLIDCYDYTREEITMLLDDDNPDNTQPTRDNILQAIKNLVKGAKPGDRFFFYFAGHAGQKDTNNPEEEDGKDEHIVSCDGLCIKDDILHKRLVKPIPTGCILRAVIDACHSGSLLDLEHYACNRVYVPWISQGGKRRMRTLWYRTTKQNAILIPALQTSSRPIPRSSNGTFRSSITNTSGSLVGVQPSIARSTRISRSKTCRLTVVTENHDYISNQMLFTQSPIEEICSPEARFCDGIHCFNEDATTTELLSNRADVLCLSSSRDEQKTWEDETGGSMTQKLVKLLRTNSKPTLHGMMTLVSHEVHDFYVDFHPSARQFKKRLAVHLQERAARQAANMYPSSLALSSAGPANSRKPRVPAKSLSLEMVNFQDPELSSHFPIKREEMHTRLWDL